MIHKSRFLWRQISFFVSEMFSLCAAPPDKLPWEAESLKLFFIAEILITEMSVADTWQQFLASVTWRSRWKTPGSDYDQAEDNETLLLTPENYVTV